MPTMTPEEAAAVLRRHRFVPGAMKTCPDTMSPDKRAEIKAACLALKRAGVTSLHDVPATPAAEE